MGKSVELPTHALGLGLGCVEGFSWWTSWVVFPKGDQIKPDLTVLWNTSLDVIFSTCELL